MFSIIYEPVVLEGLKSYNNDVKYGYVQRELTNDEVEYLKLFEEEIEVRLKYRNQMRRWEILWDVRNFEKFSSRFEDNNEGSDIAGWDMDSQDITEILGMRYALNVKSLIFRDLVYSHIFLIDAAPLIHYCCSYTFNDKQLILLGDEHRKLNAVKIYFEAVICQYSFNMVEEA
ncbi:hypothetical protein Tco_0054373 [Tanacetum coccineum]